MSVHANQHFVPQFYFKRFSCREPYINVLLMKNGQSISNAPIKGQCARNGFYGSTEIENLFSKLESTHAAAFNRMYEIAWSSSPNSLTPEILRDLLEAIIFQRSRTQLTINKMEEGMEPMLLELFRQYIECADDIKEKEILIKTIEDGQVRLIFNHQQTVLRSISIALEAILLLSDLGIRILRNQTNSPFIFSDSPVVFYNSYHKNTRDRGVLGCQTPGLQIFFPIDSDTMIMMIDEQVYDGSYKASFIFDVVHDSDIWQLNALQMFHSLNAIYYASENANQYVRCLWQSVKDYMLPVHSIFKKKDNILIDGKPEENILHVYERQLNLDLELSFINKCSFNTNDNIFTCRNPDLHKEYMQRDKETERRRNKKRGLSN